MFSLLVLMSCFLGIHMLAENFSVKYTETMFSADSVFTATDKLSCAHLCYFKYGCCVMFAFKEVEKTCHISRTIGDLSPSSQGIAVYTRTERYANYTITVVVGSHPDHGSDAHVSAQFFGNSCHTQQHELDEAETDDLAPGSSGKYQFRDVEVGEISKTRLIMRMVTDADNWFVVRVILEKVEICPTERKTLARYTYEVNKWFNSTVNTIAHMDLQYDVKEYL